MTAPTSPGVVPADVRMLAREHANRSFDDPLSPIAAHIERAIMADRANRPSLTEDERGQVRREATVLRGQIAHLKPCTLRNPTWHISPDRGYVIVDAERSEGHAPGVPGSLYYRLVNDRKEVIDLLATMFEIRTLADRSEPRQEKEGDRG